jgi:hypothetical protein
MNRLRRLCWRQQWRACLCLVNFTLATKDNQALPTGNGFLERIKFLTGRLKPIETQDAIEMLRLDGKSASAALRAGNNAGMLFKKEEKRAIETIKTCGRSTGAAKKALNNYAAAAFRLAMEDHKACATTSATKKKGKKT